MSCEIDQAAVARLDDLLTTVQREAPRRLASETRRAAIYICQSLRSRTKKAPKRARPREMLAVPSPVPPRYIHSNSAGHRLLRRWQLTRKVGTPDEYTKQHYVYTNAHRAKNGRMVGKSPAAERRELFRLHGGIPRAGLAKKSWGWVMKQIYNAAATADLAWKRTKGERRDPRRYVKGVFEKGPLGAMALIRNGLDYIGATLPPGGVTEAVNAATKRMSHNIEEFILGAENAPTRHAPAPRGIDAQLAAYNHGERATPPKGFQLWKWL